MSRLTSQPPNVLLPLVGAVVFFAMFVAGLVGGLGGFALLGPLATTLLLVLLSFQGRRVNRERDEQQPQQRRR